MSDLTECEIFPIAIVGTLNIATMLTFCKLLDSARTQRALQLRLTRFEASGRAGATLLTQLRTDMHNTGRELCAGTASLTRSMTNRVSKWVRRFTQAELEFFLINFPLKPWRELANMCHIRPSAFTCPYFAGMVFGSGVPPEGSVVAAFRALHDSAQIPESLAVHPELAKAYSSIRQKFQAKPALKVVSQMLTDEEMARELQQQERGGHRRQRGRGARGGQRQPVAAGKPVLCDAAKEALALMAPIQDVLWYYEELHTPETARLVRRRLEAGEELDRTSARTNYAKLMERVLAFKSYQLDFADLLLTYADARLHETLAALSSFSCSRVMIAMSHRTQTHTHTQMPTSPRWCWETRLVRWKWRCE